MVGLEFKGPYCSKHNKMAKVVFGESLGLGLGSCVTRFFLFPEMDVSRILDIPRTCRNYRKFVLIDGNECITQRSSYG